MRTRVKFCGFTREQDVQYAVQCGVDAIGLVFYEPSLRYVSPERARTLCQSIPAMVSVVGLFVNADAALIKAVLAQVPIQVVQLHGDESFEWAVTLQAQLSLPVIKAVRVNQNTDWAQIAQYAPLLAGILLDSDSVGFGGSGHGFDWQAIPSELQSKIILSGGLQSTTVTQAIQSITPFAVDVSSGIESAKGIKDPEKMTAFMQAVRVA